MIATLVMCCIAVTALSQQKIRYKPVSIVLAFGQATQHAEGALFSFETAGQIKNNRIGLRIEGTTTDMKALNSAMLTYDRYFFDNDWVRFSVGTGIGDFRSTERGGCSPGPGSGVTTTRHDMKHFGGMFRIGVTISHVKLGAEYNIVPPTIASAVTSEGKISGTNSYANSYFGFKFGFVLGGGRIATAGRE